MTTLRSKPFAVRPEPVEGLSFFPVPPEEKGHGFDKLSPNGGGGLRRSLLSAGSRS